MILPHHIILAIGLLLPAVSWITLGLSLNDRWRHGRNSSPVFIPVFGPLIISGWIVATHRSPLWIPLAWVADIGTLAFLRASPWIIHQWWDTSWWTRTNEFRAARDDWSARLTLHSTGAYTIVYERHSGGLGVNAIYKAGKFRREGDEIHLEGVLGNHHDLKLTRESDGRLRAVREGTWTDPATASYAGWSFQEV